jgi:integrase
MMPATGCRVGECLALGRYAALLELDGLVTHTLRKTVATFLDDADVSTRRISDQLGHARVSMTQDRYLGRRLTDRQTADVLEALFDGSDEEKRPKTVP